MLKEFSEKKLKALSEITETEISFVEDGNRGNITVPAYDVDQIISKILGLFVLNGIHVPHSFAPSYNSVHACVEFWKNRISEVDESDKKVSESISKNPEEKSGPDKPE